MKAVQFNGIWNSGLVGCDFFSGPYQTRQPVPCQLPLPICYKEARKKEGKRNCTVSILIHDLKTWVQDPFQLTQMFSYSPLHTDLVYKPNWLTSHKKDTWKKQWQIKKITCSTFQSWVFNRHKWQVMLICGTYYWIYLYFLCIGKQPITSFCNTCVNNKINVQRNVHTHTHTHTRKLHNTQTSLHMTKMAALIAEQVNKRF